MVECYLRPIIHCFPGNMGAKEQKTELKRIRSENFPNASLSYLVDLVEENHEVIKPKHTNAKK